MLGVQFVKAVKDHSEDWTPELEEAWHCLVRVITFYVKSGWVEKVEHGCKDVLHDKMAGRTFQKNGSAKTNGVEQSWGQVGESWQKPQWSVFPFLREQNEIGYRQELENSCLLDSNRSFFNSHQGTLTPVLFYDGCSPVFVTPYWQSWQRKHVKAIL